MSNDFLYIILQFYGLGLIVVGVLFFKKGTHKKTTFTWKKIFLLACLDLLLWIAGLVLGGLLFKGELIFLIYFFSFFALKGIFVTILRPIKPLYMNYLHFSPPIISGVILGMTPPRD